MGGRVRNADASRARAKPPEQLAQEAWHAYVRNRSTVEKPEDEGSPSEDSKES